MRNRVTGRKWELFHMSYHNIYMSDMTYMHDGVRLSHISDARTLFQDCLQCPVFLHV